MVVMDVFTRRLIGIGVERADLCTARSTAPRQRDAPAHHHLLLPRLIITLGGSIVAVCFRLQLQWNYEFATHTLRSRSRRLFLKCIGNIRAAQVTSLHRTLGDWLLGGTCITGLVLLVATGTQWALLLGLGMMFSIVASAG